MVSVNTPGYRLFSQRVFTSVNIKREGSQSKTPGCIFSTKEDGCKGWFWRGRCKGQALLEKKTLLACMAYEDIIPGRVGCHETSTGFPAADLVVKCGIMKSTLRPTLRRNHPQKLRSVGKNQEGSDFRTVQTPRKPGSRVRPSAYLGRALSAHGSPN